MHWEENHFNGQQEGERILYVIRPHSGLMIGGMLRNTLLAAFFVAGWLRGGTVIDAMYPGVGMLGWPIIIFAYLGSCAWVYKYSKGFRVFVTDRRLVRFEPAFPVTEARRTLFWKDVLKTKTLSNSVVCRLLRIGSLEVVPSRGDELGLRIPYVFYHEDLANYFDKIVYLTNAEPEQLKVVRPFIAAPKGQRYPDLLDAHQVDEDFIEVAYDQEQVARRLVARSALKLPEN